MPIRITLFVITFILPLIIIFFKTEVSANINTQARSMGIQAKIGNGSWKQFNAVYPMVNQKLVLKPTVPYSAGATIRWYRIIPDISELYKNANFPWDPDPYKWIGYAKINYTIHEMKEYRNRWQISPRFRSGLSSLFGYARDDYGSFWISAEITKNGIKYASPGLETVDHRGLSPNVFRISLRKSSGYIGYLTTFFNVPGLFGSVQYQSYNYIGVDCADVLMAAYGRWKKQPVKKNYNVAMLVESLPKIAEFKLSSGLPEKTIRWSTQIKPGDFIAVKGSGYSQYYHIGAVVDDTNKNGILDDKDTVLHAGPAPLHYSSLGDGVFDGHVVILRPAN